MKPIKKINQLKTIESFIQADFVKGYKYIDKAGELINRFHEGNIPPKFLMNLDGLVIYHPDPKTKEIKVSPTSFWAHFLSPNSLDQISQLFTKKLIVINDVLQPDGYSRLGWRNYFILEISKLEKDLITKNLVPSQKFDFKQLAFSINVGSIENNFNIAGAYKKNDPNSPAILLDVDSFITYNKPVDIDQIVRDLKNIREFIVSDQFLKIINQVIGKDK